MAVAKKVAERIQTQLKKYRSVLEQQRSRDVSEADTVTVIKDLLCDVFGFDKYAEVTSEHAIRGTYCDLSIQLEGKVRLLIEVKAINTDLRESHIKQAIDYAANQGVDWVVLTNGAEWILFHVLFNKPIDKEEVARFDLLEVNARQDSDLEKLFLLTKEGLSRDVLTEYRDKRNATSRYVLAALLVNSEAVKQTIRREVRRISEILVDLDEIERVLREQVIKRDTLEGEQADVACRRVNRKSDRSIVRRTSEEDSESTPPTAPEPATHSSGTGSPS